MVQKKRLLIVDDEPDLREVLVELCAELADEIVTANDGREALVKVAEAPFHTILCDISMPRMNGLEFLSELRAQGDETPFIVLTGYGDKQNATEALRLGAQDFLGKPCPVEILTSTVSASMTLGLALCAFEAELAQMTASMGLSPDALTRVREAKKRLWLMSYTRQSKVRKSS